MSKHAAPRLARQRGGNRSGKVRALLSLGLLLGIAAPGTLAYWTDSATMTGGTFGSGTLNLKLSSPTQPSADSLAHATFNLVKMLPGESKAAAVTLHNSGDAPFTYSATATSTLPEGATGDLSSQLRFYVTVGGTVSGGDRTGTCDGPDQLGPFTLGAAATTIIAASPPGPALTAGNQQAICIVALLPWEADNLAQGKSAVATFAFQADQAN